MDIEQSLKAIDKTEALLRRLKQLWAEIENAVSSAAEFSWNDEHKKTVQIKSLEFREILSVMPKIRNVGLEDKLPDYAGVFQAVFDAKEIGEFYIEEQVRESAYVQGLELARYERLLMREKQHWRHRLVQAQVALITSLIDDLVLALTDEDQLRQVPDARIQPVVEATTKLGNILGDTVRWPKAWSDLHRHLRFRQVHDIRGIQKYDWPAVMPAVLQTAGELDLLDSLPPDIAQPVAGTDSGGVASEKLAWGAITPETFERVCADLFRNLPGWEDVRWLTHTNAPDRGRDIEGYIVTQHPVRGTVRDYVVVQCKHRPKGSIGPSDIDSLPNLVRTHGPVKDFIIVTSGKFTDTTVQIVKSWNSATESPQFQLWDRWKLEAELAKFPQILTTHELRPR